MCKKFNLCAKNVVSCTHTSTNSVQVTTFYGVIVYSGPLSVHIVPSTTIWNSITCEHSGTGGSKCEFALSYILELLACVNNIPPPFSSAGPVLGHTELLACVNNIPPPSPLLNNVPPCVFCCKVVWHFHLHFLEW